MIFAPFNSNTFQAFIDLGLLKVSEVIKINQLKVEYNFYQKKVPDDLMSLFILSSSKHSTNHALNSAINNLIHIPSFDTVTHGSCTIQLGVILHLEISFHLFMYILTLIKITSRSSLTSSVCPACPCPPCTHPRTPILKKNYWKNAPPHKSPIPHSQKRLNSKLLRNGITLKIESLPPLVYRGILIDNV